MKLAYLTNLNAVDGSATNADRLCTEFDKREGIDITAVHIQGTGAPENFWTDLGYDAVYPRSFREGIEAVDPDIVLVHGWNADMIDYLEEMAADDDDRIYILRNGINVMENWMALYATPDPRQVTSPLMKLDLFDGIFAPSRAAAERLDFAYGPSNPHMAVAPCVIKYDKYVPQPFMEDDTLRIVTASRIAPNNYIPAPMMAAKRLSEQHEIDVEMHVLGGADQPYQQAIDGLASSIDVVEVTGHLDPDDVRPYLQAADVVCVPSVTQQAVPTIAVEAMAAGCVVLSGAYRAASEEETLVRVPADHPPSWFDALADVADSPDAARERIRDGLDAAREYDVEFVVTEAYLPFFTLLVEERRLDDG